MPHNITPKHQLQFLQNLTTYLQEFEYNVALVESDAGEDVVYTSLNVILDISSEMLQGENMLRLEAAFLPQVEEDMEGKSILQMMTPILVADEKVNQAELFALLIKLNTFLPIGSFGYWEEQNMVYHKQNNIIAKSVAPEALADFEEQLAMIQYLLTSFVPSLAAVALDGQTVKQALQNNPFAQAYTR